MKDPHNHDNFVTKADFHATFAEFEKRLTEQRIEHYAEVLASNTELKDKVAELIVNLQPVIDAQKFVVLIHAFFKWLTTKVGS